MEQADKKKLQIELKKLRELADLMLYAVQNDEDFPELQDFNSVSEIDDHLKEINRILVRNMH